MTPKKIKLTTGNFVLYFRPIFTAGSLLFTHGYTNVFKSEDCNVFTINLNKNDVKYEFFVVQREEFDG